MADCPMARSSCTVNAGHEPWPTTAPRAGRVLFVRDSRIVLLATGATPMMACVHPVRRPSHQRLTSLCRLLAPLGDGHQPGAMAAGPETFAPRGSRPADQPVLARSEAQMDVSRIRALRGPNLWSRHTAIEAIVALDAGRARPGPTCPASRARCAQRFPQIGAAATTQRAAHACRWPMRSRRATLALQAAGRLPGHLQPHHGDRREGHLPGRRRIHRRRGRPPGLRPRDGRWCAAA